MYEQVKWNPSREFRRDFKSSCNGGLVEVIQQKYVSDNGKNKWVEININ